MLLYFIKLQTIKTNKQYQIRYLTFVILIKGDWNFDTQIFLMHKKNRLKNFLNKARRCMLDRGLCHGTFPHRQSPRLCRVFFFFSFFPQKVDKL